MRLPSPSCARFSLASYVATLSKHSIYVHASDFAHDVGSLTNLHVHANVQRKVGSTGGDVDTHSFSLHWGCAACVGLRTAAGSVFKDADGHTEPGAGVAYWRKHQRQRAHCRVSHD